MFVLLGCCLGICPSCTLSRLVGLSVLHRNRWYLNQAVWLVFMFRLYQENWFHSVGLFLSHYGCSSSGFWEYAHAHIILIGFRFHRLFKLAIARAITAWVRVSVGLAKRHPQRYTRPATVTHLQLHPQHRNPHIQEIIHLSIYLLFLILELTRVCMVNVRLMATL
jgi:hypothetical protein